ncbi:MAG: aminotransferase class III [Planctomycetes bacterium GWF2_42_9]|nr:MAG: aminotransferase class III [Planctomycetes bacterium GWF2_42_9]
MNYLENGTTQKLYEYGKTRIPAGTQLLSKRPEMFLPGYWPAYFSKAKDCECWDLDGRHYYDMTTNGIGACLLGFADPDVSEAVIKRVQDGSMCTLNPPEEVELADMLCEIHPWASQVRFTRTGGETGAVAVRIARATTKRSLVAICGYHGWQDWYLAANLGDIAALDGHLLPGLNPLGVPRELKGTALAFKYNDKQGFEEIIKKYGDTLAAVVMEPARYNDPEHGFLEFVRDKTHQCGALLIFDEITIGWRVNYGGIHLKFDVNPDIAFFAKTLGNGHPMGAVIGTKNAMDGANTSFISSTYWTESVGPAAALATLKKMKEVNVSKHVNDIGNSIVKMWNKYAAKYNIKIDTGDGYSALAHFKFVHESSNVLKTLFTQLMLEKGILASTVVYSTFAHNEKILGIYEQALDDVFSRIANILQDGKLAESLKGPEAHTGFARLIN